MSERKQKLALHTTKARERNLKKASEVLAKRYHNLSCMELSFELLPEAQRKDLIQNMRITLLTFEPPTIDRITKAIMMDEEIVINEKDEDEEELEEEDECGELFCGNTTRKHVRKVFRETPELNASKELFTPERIKAIRENAGFLQSHFALYFLSAYFSTAEGYLTALKKVKEFEVGRMPSLQDREILCVIEAGKHLPIPQEELDIVEKLFK
jgi:DNA-binding transcriptional regulator YiaG